MFDVLHVICTRLHPGHFSILVGDSLWRSEEIVKLLNCIFQCDYYYYYYYYYYCCYKAGLLTAIPSRADPEPPHFKSKESWDVRVSI